MNFESNYSSETVKLCFLILSVLCSVLNFANSNLIDKFHSIGHDSHHCNHKYPEPHEVSTFYIRTCFK